MMCLYCGKLTGSGYFRTALGVPVHYWCDQLATREGARRTSGAIQRGDRMAGKGKVAPKPGPSLLRLV